MKLSIVTVKNIMTRKNKMFSHASTCTHIKVNFLPIRYFGRDHGWQKSPENEKCMYDNIKARNNNGI